MISSLVSKSLFALNQYKWISNKCYLTPISAFQASSSEGNNLQRTLKDGYESDSTLSYRRHQFVPQQSQNKSLYTQVRRRVITWPGAGVVIMVCIQVQKGGEVPTQGLRMQAPDKKGEKKYFRFRENIISMTSSLQHAETETI